MDEGEGVVESEGGDGVEHLRVGGWGAESGGLG